MLEFWNVGPDQARIERATVYTFHSALATQWRRGNLLIAGDAAHQNTPSGGFGKVTGLVFALVILQLISTAFNLLNFSQFLTLAIWGATLILVSGVTRLREHFLR